MSHKVKLEEVTQFSDEQYNETMNLLDGIGEVRSNIDQIIQMDTFQGEAADCSKAYFNEIHITILQAFEDLFIALSTTTDKHIEAFQANVDANESAIIESNYLEEQVTKIDDQYNELAQVSNNINRIIQSVSDISTATQPSLNNVTSHQEDVIEVPTKLDKNLSEFTSSGKSDINNINTVISEIESLISQIEAKRGSAQSNSNWFKEGLDWAYEHEFWLQRGANVAGQSRTAASSNSMYNAGKDGGLDTSQHRTSTGTGYRINATSDALEQLGVKPDGQARRDLNKRLPKNGQTLTVAQQDLARTNQTTLRAADQRPGRPGWTNTGQQALNMHPELQYFGAGSNTVTPVGSAKEIVKAGVHGAARGAVGAFTDVLKKSTNTLSKVAKGAGVFGAGLSAYTNFRDAEEDGLSGWSAVGRAAKDTTIDLAVGGAVQAGITAAFTVAIPIPGVGTAVGMAAGIGANALLNVKFGKSDKSVMDRVKGWFN
ncbi:T7SS effector LXG polymorphic toxin [Halalkalibacter sp. APA_J-10(15)]|uniref:T7SS effector LXG polymorphic toxin n=1 Tax=Halalkalibacter sp. APA_J-10(15) TaxID=2933805 RepID=UPI001FF2670F|nr:T7SS effector LXG polymorphic toxin [Halalkalibacter sp. APA_J-10(15)]MCK0473463.1 LXG domain-containing protein [Halalkalibacter sp. APA_J-10(15)]